jgi:hypothetical protein
MIGHQEDMTALSADALDRSSPPKVKRKLLKAVQDGSYVFDEIVRWHFHGEHKREVSRDQARLRIVRSAKVLDPTSIVVRHPRIRDDR